MWSTTFQFEVFLDILRQSGCEELVAALEKPALERVDKSAREKRLQQQLTLGRVPRYLNAIVRQDKLRLIWTHLWKLSSIPHGTRALIVHGMASSGKSVLAAEALRSCAGMEECFQNQVIWKSVGEVRNRKGEHLKEAIVQLLWSILRNPVLQWSRPDFPGDSDCEHVKQELIQCLRYRPLLLVLDDVWNSEVLASFQDIPIVLLVTTRNRSVASSLSSAHVDYVDAVKCSKEEATAIASQVWQQQVPESMLQRILRQCDGLPLALSAMAATLKGKSPEEQEQLLTSTSPVWLLVCPLPQSHKGYDSLAEALEASILDLENNSHSNTESSPSGSVLLDLYLNLAVLVQDQVIGHDTLCHLWTNVDVQQALDQLQQRDLIVRQPLADAKGLPTYSIHPVQLVFLKELVISREQTLDARSRNWIRAYLRRIGEHHLLALCDETDLRGFSHMCAILQAMESSGEWWQCSQAMEAVLHEWTQLGQFQQGILKLLFSKVGPSGWTALHQACQPGSEESGRILLDMGANVDAETLSVVDIPKTETPRRRFPSLCTPLHVSSGLGHCSMSQLLLSRGASIHAADMNGHTALHWAVKNGIQQLSGIHRSLFAGHTAVAKELLSEGALIECVDINDKTALHWACLNGHPQAVALLHSRSAEVASTDKSGMTPLHFAAKQGDVEIVHLLLREGMDRNMRNCVGQTPLHCACWANNLEAAKLLLDDSNTELVDDHGRTALHLASMRGHQDIVELLLSRGANKDAVTRDGSTALHTASEQGWSDVFKTLLDAEASSSIRNLRGHLAHQECASLALFSGDKLKHVTAIIESLFKSA